MYSIQDNQVSSKSWWSFQVALCEGGNQKPNGLSHRDPARMPIITPLSYRVGKQRTLCERGMQARLELAKQQLKGSVGICKKVH